MDQYVTSLLAFCCVNEADMADACVSGLRPREQGLPLYERFEAAHAACSERLLVIDLFPAAAAGLDWRVFAPPSSLVNASPYRRPVSVTAAGGLVTRQRSDRLEILLIFRRGVWDLPKGKRDAGETTRACAVREVQEELGIGNVRLGKPLGQTVHGYAEGEAYIVKTTHWFEMTTGAQELTPQIREGIEEAAWFDWNEARRRIGFESLRRHMDRVGPLLERGL